MSRTTRRRPRPCQDHAGRPIHCPPGRFPAQLDLLFRNDGDGTFTDVSAEAGLEVPDGRGLGLAIADLDGDGRLDLFVANDALPDFLFRNLGGLRFEEVGAAAGVAFDGSGRATASMGVVADDLDGDGLIDLFHTNFLQRAEHPATATSAAACSPTPPLAGRPGRPEPGGHRVRRRRRSTPTTTACSTCSSPTATSTTSPGSTARWPSPRNCSSAGATAGSPWPIPSLPRTFAPPGRRPGAGGRRPGQRRPGRPRRRPPRRPGAPCCEIVTTGRATGSGLRLIGHGLGPTPVGARVIGAEAGGRRIVRWLTARDELPRVAPTPASGSGSAGPGSVDRLEIRWPSGAVQSSERFAAIGSSRSARGGSGGAICRGGWPGRGGLTPRSIGTPREGRIRRRTPIMARIV